MLLRELDRNCTRIVFSAFIKTDVLADGFPNRKEK